MPNVEHPAWCDRTRCQLHELGPHESRPVKILAGKGQGKAPRITLLLWAPPKGHPVRIRIVTIGDLIISTLDVDLDAAALLAAQLNDLIGVANQPNG